MRKEAGFLWAGREGSGMLRGILLLSGEGVLRHGEARWKREIEEGARGECAGEVQMREGVGGARGGGAGGVGGAGAFEPGGV